MKEVLVRKPTIAQKELLEAQPTWEHDREKWEAIYDEREETCLIIEGKGYVELLDGARFAFEKGDLVTFKPNLKCIWCVEEYIKKHYIFGLGFFKSHKNL